MITAGALYQPISGTTLDANPRSGGIDPGYYRALRDEAVKFRAKYPKAGIMGDRLWGQARVPFIIGYQPDGKPIHSEVYGPAHASIELDPVEGKTVNQFSYDTWHGIATHLYGGPPPWGMSVTSATEAKAFLGPWWKAGIPFVMDMLGSSAAASTMAAYCSSAGVRIPLLTEPHGPASHQWSRSVLIAGGCSLADRMGEMLAGTSACVFHPGLNYCMIQGGTKPADRVTLALACIAHGVVPFVELYGLTDAQKDAIFAPVAATDPATVIAEIATDPLGVAWANLKRDELRKVTPDMGSYDDDEHRGDASGGD